MGDEGFAAGTDGSCDWSFAKECRSRVRARSLVLFLLSPFSWAVFAEKSFLHYIEMHATFWGHWHTVLYVEIYRMIQLYRYTLVQHPRYCCVHCVVSLCTVRACVAATRQCTSWSPWSLCPLLTVWCVQLPCFDYSGVCEGVLTLFLYQFYIVCGSLSGAWVQYLSCRIAPAVLLESHETPPFHNCSWMVECSCQQHEAGEHLACV